MEIEFVHGKKREFRHLKSDDSLSEIRGQLGSFMAEQDLFTYYDPRQKQQFVQLKSSESKYRLADVLLHRNKAAIIDPDSDVPDLQGQMVSSFSDRRLHVSIGLSQNRAGTLTANEGKINPVMEEPVMLEKVHTIRDAANSIPDLYWDYAVICQEGSLIQLDYSCSGASGVDISHEVYPRTSRPLPAGDPYFNVSSLDDMGIPDCHRLKYCYLKVTAWQAPGYPGDGITESQAENKPGTGNASPEPEIKKDALIIPGTSIKSAVPYPLTEMPRPSRANGSPGLHHCRILGEMNIYFLVYAGEEDARQLLRQQQ